MNPQINGFRRRTAVRLASIICTIISTQILAACASLEAPRGESFGMDQPSAWAGRIKALPVEVHSEGAQFLASSTVHAIPNAVAAGTADLGAAPRLVVYIGGAKAPQPKAYCDRGASLDAVRLAPQGELLLRATLCDGSRAVAYASRAVNLPQASGDNQSAAPDFGGAVDDLKEDLMSSLRGNATPPYES